MQPNKNLKIIKGIVEIRKDDGKLVRKVGKGEVLSAALNPAQTHLAIVTDKGKVEIRRDNGVLVRTIGNGNAVDVTWEDNNVAITTSEGGIEVRQENGTLIQKRAGAENA